MKISLKVAALKNADDLGTHVDADAVELARVSAAAASSVGGGRPPRLVNVDRAAPDEELVKDEVELVIVVGLISLFVGQGPTPLREVVDESVAVPVTEDGKVLGDAVVEAGADANVPVPGEVVAELGPNLLLEVHGSAAVQGSSSSSAGLDGVTVAFQAPRLIFAGTWSTSGACPFTSCKKSGSSRGLLPRNNMLSEDLARLFGAAITGGWNDVDADAVLGDEVVLDDLFHGALVIRSFQTLSLAEIELVDGETRVSAAAASSAGGGRPPGLGTESRG